MDKLRLVSLAGVLACFCIQGQAQSAFPADEVQGHRRLEKPKEVVVGPGVRVEFKDTYEGGRLGLEQRGGMPFLVGVKGQRYAIRVENTEGDRKLVVISVDGVNVVTGASAATRQTGYVLGPYSSALIEGWRKSDTEVAAFTFSSVENAYASKTGRSENVGIIGFAWFREKRQAPVTAEGADSTPKMKAQGMMAERSPSLGTGHGERLSSEARKTTFEREDNPFWVQKIRYGLSSESASGYVPDPGSGRSWRTR